MNIHEYQAKELLAKFGVPVPGGLCRDERRGSGRGRPEAARAACGSSRRRSTPAAAARASSRSWATDAKGGVRLAHSIDEVREHAGGDARQDAGHDPDRPRTASRSSGSTSPTASTSPRNSTSRCWSTARPAASPSSPRPKAAWTSRRSPTTRPRRSTRSPSIPATGLMPHHGRAVAAALGLTGDLAKQARQGARQALRRVRRHRRLADRDQPARGHRQGRADGARRQGRLRQQCRVPPPGPRGAARPHRRRSDGDRGVEIRPRLHQARRQHRLHGQRRRPRHGDDGHHQAEGGDAGQLPRRRRRRQQGKGHRGVQDHPAATRR